VGYLKTGSWKKEVIKNGLSFSPAGSQEHEENH
jgi:hypothetical protein